MRTESQIEFENIYPDRKGEYSGIVWINDTEYPAVVGYRDEGHYTFVVSPNATIESIVISPCDGLVIDLMGDGYGWLVHQYLLDRLVIEIELKLSNDHWERLAA